MKLSEAFPSNYLKADDLQGRAVAVTISGVELKKFDNGDKLVLSFRGKEKQLVANITNCHRIAEVLGNDETDDWIGQTIVLRTEKVEFQGKVVPAIRVDMNAEVPVKAAPVVVIEEDDGDSGIPF